MHERIKVFVLKTQIIGGKRIVVADPYTLVVGRSMYSIGDPETTPFGQAVNQYSGEIGRGRSIKSLEPLLGKLVPINKLPKGVKEEIKKRLRLLR
jgi:hypothetical protein